MTQPAGSIVIQVPEHRLGYVSIPCYIGQFESLSFLLHTGRPLSYHSVDLFEGLKDDGLCTEIGGGIHRVSGLMIAGQSMRDLSIRVSSAPGILEFDGFLGLHFLGQFSRVAYEREIRLLTLTY